MKVRRKFPMLAADTHFDRSFYLPSWYQLLIPIALLLMVWSL